MLKNKLRIHVGEAPLSPVLCELFSRHSELASELYQIDRLSLLDFLSDDRFPGMEISLDHIVFVINELYMHNSQISALTPESLQAHIKRCARKR